ncbi:MAG TPA: aldehyde dehydrogenase family protein, partial [Chryseosolibacter sp.]
MNLFKKHEALLEKATEALHSREFFAAFPEHPAPAVYGETADADGQKKFKEHLSKDFKELLQDHPESFGGQEESPYLQEPLKIQYPLFSASTLVARSGKAFDQWRKASYEDRAGVLMESLERFRSRFFEIAYATMHTTGQGFMMAFQASGPHAADRALEAIAAGFEELRRFPAKAVWDKPMGKSNVRLNKEWRAVPKGISLVVGCSTFPTWNSVTGIYGSLVTGNTVIVKPHPGAILP